MFAEKPIEEVKNYWDSRPCNVRHSPRQAGSVAYFDEVENRKYRVEPHILDFADFPKWKGKRVLELGCGIGTATISFARAGADVTAADLSSASLDLAKQRAQVFGLADKIRFFQANGEELSKVVPVEPHDLVWSFGVIHHTPHPDRALRELRRYLKPGGTIKIMVYNRWSWKVLWILLVYGGGRLWKLSELIARYSEAQTGCPVTYSYSRRSAREFMESNGFRVTDIHVDHIFPYRIPDYVEYRYVKEWYFRWMPNWMFRGLERALGWHLMITATAV